MDVLRRNTDYALRAMVHLARRGKDGPVSTRDIAAAEGISYELTCKLMQKLAGAGLVKSTMGSGGGFELKKRLDNISLANVIEAVQGRISLNRCLLGDFKCPHKRDCPVYEKLADLQVRIDDYFTDVTLADLLKTSLKRKNSQKSKRS